VIRPEQLAQALERIHPRDRELLALSLRRRVPDEALARLYDCEPTEVARRRARAIERLADEMELQRGEDLGAVLKALLEPETWSAVEATLGEEFAVGAGGARLASVPPPEPQEAPPSGPALAPVPVPVPEREPAPAAAEREPAPAEPEPEGEGEPAPAAAPAEPDPEPAAARPAPAPPREEPPGPAPTASKPAAEPTPANQPVLEMLAAREREAPDPPRRAVPLALIGLGVASLVGAAAVVGATQFGDTNRVLESSGGDGDDDTRDFVPAQGGPLEEPFPTEPRKAACYSTAYLPQPTVLYTQPGGRERLRITARTEWGSPRVLGVLEQRGDWLGVQAAELRNGEIAWVPRERARTDCVRWSLHADLSKRRLLVRRDGRTVRKMRVAVGRRGNPTPKGRFTVTDKLRVTDPGSPYGCCVLALSGHQTNLPDYWPGGDRLAVHATSDESSIGRPVSLGCLRAESRRARWLIETVPLGAPIFIRA
jgi:L,D-transpeptidase catalytic domain